MTEERDYVVIGGGLVGLAVARAILLRHPDSSLTLLEKEPEVALHQSGRNSGVIHSGIYYPPGSKKAENCRHGKRLLEAYCEEEGIRFRRIGKVIVATDLEELPALEKIAERGRLNGVQFRMIDGDELREIEPHVRGVKALHVEEAGIVDYPAVARSLVRNIEKLGGSVLRGASVSGFRADGSSTVVESTRGAFHARMVVNCAGLHSDRICRLAGLEPGVQICPFRGEYYLLRPEAARLCRTLIYPVPDPRYPFLGVHFTRRIDDTVECGPNAVLALAREGYRHSSVNLGDLFELLRYGGFWQFARTNLREGMKEFVRSLSRARFTQSLQKLVPEVQESDLLVAPSGVRAQAILPSGKLVDDFLFQEGERSLHVLNAPSPAATSCLSIGEHVADRIEKKLG